MMSEKRVNGFAKDSVYRFVKSANINWLRFTTMLSSRIVSTTIEKLTDEERINVLIVDDTMFERNKSKHVELLRKYMIMQIQNSEKASAFSRLAGLTAIHFFP